MKLLDEKGANCVLSWKHHEKPKRVVALAEFFARESIETEKELRDWVRSDSNMLSLLSIRGIGPKTADYIKILVGSQTAAVDRHVFSLLKEARIPNTSYDEALEIMNLAADIFGVERTLFDHSIWQYMSKRNGPEHKKSCTPDCNDK